MARYGIFDEKLALEYIDSVSIEGKNSKDHKILADLIINSLVLFKKHCILSPEETEAKFKEIWEDGYGSGSSDGHRMGFYLKDWNEFKNNL